MTMERHDEIVDRLEEYILGQLPEGDRRAVEAHLRVCDRCETELRGLSAAMEALADSVPPAIAPPALRARVLARIASEPQDSSSDVLAFRAPSRSTAKPAMARMWSARSLAAAAAIVIGVGALLWSVNLSRRVAVEQAARAEAQVDELRERIAQYTNQIDLALSVLTAADVREITLAGRENATASAARAYWSPTRGLLVVADRLPTPPPGRVYQVWVIENGAPASAGLLGSEAAGRGFLVAPPPRPGATGGVTVAVTDEPPGGLPAPSGTIRLAGSV